MRCCFIVCVWFTHLTERRSCEWPREKERTASQEVLKAKKQTNKGGKARKQRKQATLESKNQKVVLVPSYWFVNKELSLG